MGRRPLFFLALAVVCAVLIPPTPAEVRWVNLVMGGLALFWCLMLAGEDLARRRTAQRRQRSASGNQEPGPAGR